ncbi:MAG: hypothetical protein ACK41T_11450, partial [Pseudobdellovibrio sp.]
ALHPKVTADFFKNPKAVKIIAESLFKQSPDVIVLQEVGDKESLQKLADMGKNITEYEAIFIQGHDQRKDNLNDDPSYDRHIGFLIKKSLGLKYKLLSNTSLSYKGESIQRDYVFDRGLPTLVFYKDGVSQPLFTVIGAHNHSLGKNAKFKDLKTIEEQAMIYIIQQIAHAYGQRHPIMLMGDMNTEVNDPRQLGSFKNYMRDSFTDQKVDAYDPRRITHGFTQLNYAKRPRQVDAVFINPVLAGRVIKTETLQMPDFVSDHRPVMVEINFKGLMPVK